MLSYQHIYHAGNFADIHKHSVLIETLRALKLKPQPLDILDTHAGRGIYDLSSTEAHKTAEFVNGISFIWGHWKQKSALEQASFALKPLMEQVARLNPDGELKLYPGSADIAQSMLRPNDKLTAIEKHPGEFLELAKSLRSGAVQGDGLQTLASLPLPVAGRKRVVVIDPSYEIKTDYQDVPQRLAKAWVQAPQGCFILWYPLMANGAHRDMLTILRKAVVKDVMLSEIRLQAPPQDGYRMTGTGMAIINPPWPEEHLRRVTQSIAKALPMKSFADVFWLDNLKINPETGRLVL